MQEYYFDTLPLHPQPERLESLTSYLIRLAEANGHSDRDTFALFFRPLGIETLADYPSALFNILQTLAQCPEARLLGTTFYHVGRKFGRSSLPQPLAIFLQGTVAQSLRYCPMCLADHAYYFLTWRFLPLKGCYKHSCELLNKCGHCGSTIPIFGSLLKIAICPICKGDLRKCPSRPLSEEEKQRAFISTQELEFLLSPQPWEDEYSSIAEMIGHELMILRKRQQKTLTNIRQAIGSSKWNLEAMEHGFKNTFTQKKNKLLGTSFQWYLKYTSYLGITLDELFNMAIQHEAQKQQSHMKLKGAPPVEEGVLMKVEEAIQRLSSLKLPVTQKSVLKIVGWASVEKFKEQIAAMIRDEHIKQAQARADKLFSDVQSAIKQLEDLRKPITKRAIADIVGVSPRKLQNYPQISDLVNQKENYPEYLRSRYQLHEDKLLGEVEIAIKKLEDEDRAVTFRAVGDMVGMEPGNFKYYPRVRALLEQKNNYSQHRRRNTELHENELLAKVEAAILQIESSGQAPTYLAISEIVGMTPSSLNRYPRIRTLLVQKINIHHPQQNVRDIGLREDDLLAKIKIVICQLEKLGTPVTRRAISEAIGMRPNHLDQYPQIKRLLEKYTNNYYLHRSVHYRSREDDLLAKVEDAIQLLKDLGRPVAQNAIGEILGIPSNALWRYPRLREELKQEVMLYSLDDAAQIQIGETELMEKILETKSALDSSGQPATPGAIKKLLGIGNSFLKRYPQVNAFLFSLEKQDVERKRQLHEDELLIRVETAIQELKKDRQPLTQMNVGRKMGLNTGTLRRYPKVLAVVMESVTQERQQVVARHTQQQEENLMRAVLEAIQQLQALNQRVTIEAICRIAQISRTTIIHYPKVNKALDSLITRRKNALLRNDL